MQLSNATCASSELRHDRHDQAQHDINASRITRRLHRILSRILKRTALIILWLLVSLLATVFLGVLTSRIHFYAILTGSMRPTMPPGTGIVVHPEPVSRIHVGQVIVANLPKTAKSVYRQYAHRVVWVAHRGMETLVRTKGDANKLPDPWTLVFHGGIVQHEWFSVPLVGYLAAPGDHRYVWFALLVAAVVLLDAWTIRWVLRYYAYEPNQADNSGQTGLDADSIGISNADSLNNTGRDEEMISGSTPLSVLDQ